MRVAFRIVESVSHKCYTLQYVLSKKRSKKQTVENQQVSDQIPVQCGAITLLAARPLSGLQVSKKEAMKDLL